MEGRGMTEQKLARYRSTGVFFVMLSVVVATALATFAAALRTALNSGDTNEQQVKSYGLNDDQVQLFQVNGANDFEFLIAYSVELALNYFVYYPIIGTVLFSGILTCGHFPVTGGRPYELKEEAALAALEEEGGQEGMMVNGKSAKSASDIEQAAAFKTKTSVRK
jgi:hypothetical protein